jgi:hypothetical protein
VNEKWAIVPLCARHHGVDEYQDVTHAQKELAQWVALNRATTPELQAISKAIDYVQKRDLLNRNHGAYTVHISGCNTLEEESQKDYSGWQSSPAGSLFGPGS